MGEVVGMRAVTNLWHLDLGLRFLGVVGQREACDGQPTGSVSARRLMIRGVEGRVSVLARVCPRENGALVSPLEEWRELIRGGGLRLDQGGSLGARRIIEVTQGEL